MKALMKKKWFRVVLILLGIAGLVLFILYLHTRQTINGLEESLEGLADIFTALDRAFSSTDTSTVSDTLNTAVPAELSPDTLQ